MANKFKWGTKAETLEHLKGRLTSCRLLEQFYFNIEEWIDNKYKIIKEIQNRFSFKKLAVRSSAINEDMLSSSNAGNYVSVLNVDGKSEDEIIKAIEKVIESYSKNKQIQNSLNQVLIQLQVENVKLAGVIFTEDIDTGAPYYIINYDDYSGRTDIITSGKGNNTKLFTYSKLFNTKPTDKYLARLIDMVKELEIITENDRIDIEFVINNQDLYLLQVRPIATPKKSLPCKKEDLKEFMANIKSFFIESNKCFPNIYGQNVAFGIMPDWNPAEIIGVEPKQLAFSLYRELITDEIWPLSRQLVGYNDVGYQPGICSLGGKPYIDIRMSFNTFLPVGISPQTSKKLVEFYMQKLRRYQDLHDKIEFKVVYTCYQFDYEAVENEMKEHSFTQEQIKELKVLLFNLTNNILTEKITSIEHELNQTKILNSKREKIKKSDISLLTKISQLVYECKIYGTLPFSKLARFAFIGTALMKSLVRKDIITQEEYDKFYASIRTVATDFLHDLGNLKNGKITKKLFIELYGHLRPGTYDICSKTYKENFEEYIHLTNFIMLDISQKECNFSKETMKKIQLELTINGFKISSEKFLEFVRKTIRAREVSKFEFTKNLNLILEYIKIYFSQYGISREELAFLNIKDVLELSYVSLHYDFVDNIKAKIEKNKQRYAISKAIKLSPLIFIEKSVEYFHSTDSMPNYVTQKLLIGEVVYLGSSTENINITGKIVLIENADPGYDWIFSHNITGLITEFGGAASHMAIRAAEFNMPAAIGCGTALFNYVKGAKKIELNCASKHIKIII